MSYIVLIWLVTYSTFNFLLLFNSSLEDVCLNTQNVELNFYFLSEKRLYFFMFITAVCFWWLQDFFSFGRSLDRNRHEEHLNETRKTCKHLKHAFLFSARSAKMIDGSEKRKRQVAFELQNSCVFEKRSKRIGSHLNCSGLLSCIFVLWRQWQGSNNNS